MRRTSLASRSNLVTGLRRQRDAPSIGRGVEPLKGNRWGGRDHTMEVGPAPTLKGEKKCMGNSRCMNRNLARW